MNRLFWRVLVEYIQNKTFRQADWLLIAQVAGHRIIVDDGPSFDSCQWQLWTHYTAEAFANNLCWKCEIRHRRDVDIASYLDLRTYPRQLRLMRFVEQLSPVEYRAAQYTPSADAIRGAENRRRARARLQRGAASYASAASLGRARISS